MAHPNAFGTYKGPSTKPPPPIQFGNSPRSPSPPVSPFNNTNPPSPYFPPTTQQSQFLNFPPSPSPLNNNNNSSYYSPPYRSPRLDTGRGRGVLTDSGGGSGDRFQASQRAQSQSLTWERSPASSASAHTSEEPQRPIVSPPGWNAEPISFPGVSIYQTHQGPPPVAPYAAAFSTSTPVRHSPIQSSERTRTPPAYSKAHMDGFTQDVSERPTVSPPRWKAEPKSSFGATKYQQRPSVAPHATSLNVSTSTPVRPAPFQVPGRTKTPPSSNKAYVDDFTQAVSERRPTEPSNYQAPKKSRSPPLEYIWGNSHPSQMLEVHQGVCFFHIPIPPGDNFRRPPDFRSPS